MPSSTMSQNAKRVNARTPTGKSKKNQLKRKLWMEGLLLQPSDVQDPFYVCGAHFKESDFKDGVIPRKNFRLTNDAVPSRSLQTLNLDSNVAPAIIQNECCGNSQQGIRDHQNDLYVESITADEHHDAEHILTNGNEESNAMLQSESCVTEDLLVSVDFDEPDEEEIIFQLLDSNELANDAKSWNDQGVQTDPYDKMTEKVFKEKCIQASLPYGELLKKVYNDKCIQTNLAYDESLRKITLVDFIKTEAHLFAWTGIPSFLTLENIERCVRNFPEARNELSTMNAPVKTLIILVMTRIKTNLTFFDLSMVFLLHPLTLGSYFHKFVPILRAVLTPCVFWPSKEQVSANLPKCFVPNFKDCMAVMDCTEAPLEKLKSLSSRIKTYSHYKGTNTIKFNVTGSPSGLVTHVSLVWGGKASDKQIVLHERLLDNFSAYDAIMVDKGYSIGTETTQKGINLHKPPILKKPQHSRKESQLNTSIASARVHVERIMQRIKLFKLFHSKIPRSMLRHIDDVVFIVCAMVNLSPPILATNKFE